MPIPFVAAALPALPAIGGTIARGAGLGAAAHAAQKFLGRNDDENQTQTNQSPSVPGEPAAGQYSMVPPMSQGQYASMVGAPMPGQMAPAGYMPPGMMPAAVGMAGASAATMAPAVSVMPPATAENTAAPSQAESAPVTSARDSDGFFKSAAKTAMAAAAGAAGGVALKKHEGAEGTGALIQGALAGAGAGGFTKMAHDAIQKDGAGLRAGGYTAVASALGSTLTEDGPGKLSSAMLGFGGGSLSNLAHDKLEDAGKHKAADAASGAGLGGALGYAVTGDKSTALLAGAGGSAADVGLGAMDRQGGLSGVIKSEDSPLKALLGSGKDTGADVEAAQPSAGDPELG